MRNVLVAAACLAALAACSSETSPRPPLMNCAPEERCGALTGLFGQVYGIRAPSGAGGQPRGEGIDGGGGPGGGDAGFPGKGTTGAGGVGGSAAGGGSAGGTGGSAAGGGASPLLDTGFAL